MSSVFKHFSRFLTILLVVVTCLLALVPTISSSFAVEPDEILSDQTLEARARDISTHLRCLVCQNENIDDSNADLAKDLRILVRERLTAGDTNQQVKDYIVARYGEYVLLQPPVNIRTYMLWFSPLLLLLAGGIVVALFWRKQGQPKSTTPNSLSSDEEARLEKILSENEE